MSWQTPKTDWSSADGVAAADMNRIESNIQSLRSVSQNFSLSVVGWINGSRTLNSSNITATNVVELLPAPTITAEQLAALQAANIVGTAQSAGSLTMTAFGDVPTIDIPVTLIFRGDL